MATLHMSNGGYGLNLRAGRVVGLGVVGIAVVPQAATSSTRICLLGIRRTETWSAIIIDGVQESISPARSFLPAPVTGARHWRRVKYRRRARRGLSCRTPGTPAFRVRFAILTSSMKTWISEGRRVGLMEPESENRDLVHVEASSTETDADVAPLVRKVGAISIAEIEKLIGELQAKKNYLQSEADRIERETAR